VRMVSVYVPEVCTIMLCVRAPVLQKLLATVLEVSITLSPEQKAVGPDGVTTGVAGVGLTVMVVTVEWLEQPPDVIVSVNVPAAYKVMLCVRAPLLQELLMALLEVNLTLSPEQKVVGPFGVIVGIGGLGLTVTIVPLEKAEHPPLVTVSV
jgi:hypothetical protein